MKKDTLLIVDDEPLNRVLLESILRVLGYESRSAANGQQALEMLDENIDLILLDVNMPEITGFEVVRRIRAAESFSDVPVIMVTALSSMQDRLTAVEAGANDFICKPVDKTELSIRVASQLKVKHAQDAVKTYQFDLESKVEERTQSLQEANEKLAKLATTDALTGLANHRGLVSHLEAVIEQANADGKSCGVLFIDLDHFKALNDSFGHAVGDSVLSELGQLLKRTIAEEGAWGRWGGEEFVCILPDTNYTEALDLAERVRSSVAQNVFNTGCHMTCSIGVALSPGDGTARSTIAEAADRAMYVAKALGRNQVRAASDVLSSFAALRAENPSREDLALEGLVQALMSLVEARDVTTAAHTNVVRALATRLAIAMNLSAEEVHFVALVGQLHDIGKVAVPDSILLKKGPLSADEWQIMRGHVGIGAEVVKRVPSLRVLSPAIRAHHEKWDGSGYPDGLVGEDIPLAARIVAVADAFAAMTADRPYRLAQSNEIALTEIYRLSGTQFAPEVVDALRSLHTVEAVSEAA